jgi:ATP synthase protein I
VILTRDPDIRRTAARILFAQVAVMTAIAVICYALFGGRQGLSALAGGAIGVIANATMTATALRTPRSPGGVLGRLLLGQMMKVALTVALFVIAARSGRAHWPSLLGTYVATLAVFWLVPMMSSKLGKA